VNVPNTHIKERRGEVKRVSISAVDMSNAVTGGAVNVLAQRPQGEGFQTPQTPSGDFEANRENVKRMVEKMQEQINSMNVSLQYSTYGDHGERTAVAIVNKETGELIREIPAKEIQRLYSKMSELAGMIFNREI
jgi:flagellar protein FlaG